MFPDDIGLLLESASISVRYEKGDVIGKPPSHFGLR